MNRSLPGDLDRLRAGVRGGAAEDAGGRGGTQGAARAILARRAPRATEMVGS